MAKTPERSCIGCRGRAPQQELVRYTWRPEGAVAVVERDGVRRSPGRGAYLHDDEKCLQMAGDRSAFRRALRIPPTFRAELAPAARDAGSSARAAQGAHTGNDVNG